MAQRIQTLLIDDLDGGEAAATVRFGLDGTEYEIDLGAAHNWWPNVSSCLEVTVSSRRCPAEYCGHLSKDARSLRAQMFAF